MELWIAGYGSSSSRSVARVCIADGRVETLWETKIEASSYMDFSDNLLFVISEWERGSAIRLLTPNGHSFEQRDSVEIPGGQLCHITYLPRQHVLLGACYGSGDVFSVAVDSSTASFGKLLTYQKQGRGEECSVGSTRAHSILVNREETIAVSANIALDRLYLYNLHEGKLEDERFVSLPKGVGPRHFLWREDLHKIYVITEYSNEIITIQAEKNRISYLSSQSTLQDDFEGKSYGSTLVCSADGQYLYAGNRGEDTIAVFSVDQEGGLIKTGSFSCGGCWPRDLALVDSGRFLAVANQRSNAVMLLPRDPDTGALGEPCLTIPLDGASYVQDTAK